MTSRPAKAIETWWLSLQKHSRASKLGIARLTVPGRAIPTRVIEIAIPLSIVEAWPVGIVFLRAKWAISSPARGPLFMPST